MSRDIAFHMDWRIDDEDWDMTRGQVEQSPAGGGYDRTRQAFIWFLSGRLRLEQAAVSLFPQDRLMASEARMRANLVKEGIPWYPIPEDYGRDGIRVSLLDFAMQLLLILRALEPGVSDVFKENDGELKITFARDDNEVAITSNFYDDIDLRVRAGEFFAESRRFLLDFIGAIEQRLPELLQWDSLERLRNYYQKEQSRSDT